AGGPITTANADKLSFTVVHAGGDPLVVTGDTTDLTSGTPRTITATIYDLNGNVVDSGPDSTLSVAFSKDSGSGTVSGLGSATASNGVATKVVTGGLVGSIPLKADATAAGGPITTANADKLSFTVVHAGGDHLVVTG